MTAAYRVMVLAGDGVGPEIVAAAQRVLAAAASASTSPSPTRRA